MTLIDGPADGGLGGIENRSHELQRLTVIGNSQDNSFVPGGRLQAVQELGQKCQIVEVGRIRLPGDIQLPKRLGAGEGPEGRQGDPLASAHARPSAGAFAIKIAGLKNRKSTPRKWRAWRQEKGNLLADPSFQSGVRGSRHVAYHLTRLKLNSMGVVPGFTSCRMAVNSRRGKFCGSFRTNLSRKFSLYLTSHTSSNPRRSRILRGKAGPDLKS